MTATILRFVTAHAATTAPASADKPDMFRTSIMPSILLSEVLLRAGDASIDMRGARSTRSLADMRDAQQRLLVHLAKATRINNEIGRMLGVTTCAGRPLDSHQIFCADCSLTWDITDPAPPRCKARTSHE